jgi:hypothetical protein
MTTKATDMGGTKEDHEDNNMRGEEEDDAISVAPLAEKRRRRNNGEISYLRCSPSDGPLSYDDDGSNIDNDHDHYYVQFFHLFQRYVLRCCH